MAALSQVKPMPHGPVRHANAFAPFLQRKRHALELIKRCGAAIAYLRSAARPLAVRWLVVAVVVASLNAHLRRRLAHIGDKVLERLPALTYRYAAPSIVGERNILRVFAPAPHADPYVVRGSTRHSVRRSWSFLSSAPAGRCSSVPNICAIAYNNSSACAMEPPHRPATRSAANMRDRRKAPKSLSSKINESHGCNSNSLRRIVQ